MNLRDRIHRLEMVTPRYPNMEVDFLGTVLPPLDLTSDEWLLVEDYATDQVYRSRQTGTYRLHFKDEHQLVGRQDLRFL